VLVARWIVAVHRDPARRAALYADRVARHNGREYTYQFVSRLDEVREEDLPQGVRTGVVTAFENAARRFTESQLAQLREDHRVLCPLPTWAAQLPRFARVLRTPAELAQEGDDLHHCVGTYSGFVASGESVIVALSVRGHRSTVELRGSGLPDGRSVVQHRGAGNSAPHPVCERALRAVLRWIRRARRLP
jgi:hypothetical protein